jgi:hypothetical protein
MKTFGLLNNQNWPIFRHMSIVVLSALFTMATKAAPLNFDTNKINRKIASAAPEEEVLTVPMYDRPMLVTLFADDDAGIMQGMRESLNAWEKKEEYNKNWNLPNVGPYSIPENKEKRKMVSNRILKYADKRFAGEMKNAEEGSTLHSIGKVEKSLRPNAQVAVLPNITIKFKARVLQGKAIMEVRNPWIEYSTTLSANGNIKILSQKEFKEIGVKSGVEYSVRDSQWVAFIDQKITDSIFARASSTQNNRSIFSNDADKRIEMHASFPFNL